MENSLTLSLSGNSSVPEVQYFPPIELSSNKNYVLGLVELLTFNSIPNIDTSNNKSYVGEEQLFLPTGSYEIEDIANFLRETSALKGISFSLKSNNNTLRSVIKCSHPIDFRPQDSIGQVLGFTPRILEASFKHNSDLPVTILKINALRVECNITSGAYINGSKVHTIHEFFPAVPPGYKIIEVPSQVIYLPVTVKSIDYLEIR